MTTKRKTDKEAKLRRLKELEQKELALMRQMKEYRDKNLIYFFDSPPNPGPNPRQAELLEAFSSGQYKTFTFTGGNRTGKTTLLTILGLSTLFGKYPWNDGFMAGHSLMGLFNHNKPRKIRYIGQGWHDHIETVVIPELRKWWPSDRPKKTKGNGIITDTFWRDEKTGGTLEVMSNNQDHRVMEGWSGDLVLYDEPPRREVWIALARGLIDRRGNDVFAATLLGEPWLHREIINARLEDGRPDPRVFNVHGTSYDNVGYGITREGIEEFKAKLTDAEVKARIEGVPSYLEGLVYPEFSRKIHVKDRFEVPLSWPVDILIDVHPRERQAILFIATDEWNRKWLVDEVWDHGDGTWVGEQVARKVIRNAYRVNRVAVDPLAKGDQNNPNTVFDKIQQVLFKYGMVLEAATKDKDSGILEVRKHLKGPNGEPSLFVFNDLVRTIYEFEGYMWDKETQKAAKCVTGDTIIDTPSGQHRIRDLVGKDLWVYSYSDKKQRIDINRAKDIRKTGHQVEVWKLTMDRGVLFATPDHPVMLRNGQYKQLKDLNPYESLMPLYRNMTCDGYAKINTNAPGKKRWQYPGEHRFVYECIHGLIPSGMEVHHKDGNYRNHVPENLELMTPNEHAMHHLQDGTSLAKCAWCGEEFHQNKRWQKHCSKKCRQAYGDSRRIIKIPTIAICEYCGKSFKKAHGAQKYCSVTCRGYAYRDSRRVANAKNHKVLSVEFYGYEDVYNMEVENDHNFCANGIFVHNCDDHMMEDLYRGIMLNTEYSDIEEEHEDDFIDEQGRSATGGY